MGEHLRAGSRTGAMRKETGGSSRGLKEVESAVIGNFHGRVAGWTMVPFDLSRTT